MHHMASEVFHTVTNAIHEKIQEVFNRLSQPVFLLDRQGRCLVPAQPDTFILPSGLREDTPVSRSGYLFLALPGLSSQVLAVKDRPNAADIIYLASQLIAAIRLSQDMSDDLNNALKRLLTGNISAQEIESLADDIKVKDIARRSLMLISVKGLRGQNAKEALGEVLPLAPGDLLVHLDIGSAVLVRDWEDEDAGEPLEYAMALQDTLQNELGLQAQIGIGEIAPTLADLHESYQQARQAVEIGSLFCPDTQIFEYCALVLERFLAEVPPETATRYTALLFNHRNVNLFSDEMLDTVIVFIKKNLNLSDAARELYIHRNTLVYRLDKILRQCGLDLRLFEDAMLFKLLYNLRIRETRKTKPQKPRNERN
jgi:sugar diacid utilization regulator